MWAQLNHVQAFFDACKDGGNSEKWFFGELDQEKPNLYVVEEPHESSPEEELQKLLRMAGVPTEFVGKTVEDVKPRDDIPGFDKAIMELRSFLADIRRHARSGKGITFYGDCGTGKTMLAALVARATLQEGGGVVFTNSRQMFDRLKPGGDSSGFADDLLNTNVLIIDDLGSEYMSEYTLAELDRIISGRHAAMKPTVITTNFYRDEFQREMVPRVVDRLQERNVEYELRGSSYRQREERDASS